MKKQTINLAVITTDKNLLKRLFSALHPGDCHPRLARITTPAQFLQHLGSHCPDLVLLLESTGISVSDYLPVFLQHGSDIPFIAGTARVAGNTGTQDNNAIELLCLDDEHAIRRSLEQQLRYLDLLKRNRQLERTLQDIADKQQLAVDSNQATSVGLAAIADGNIDILTRLENMAGFCRRLEIAIASIPAQDTDSLLFVVRIENFAAIRETFGKPATNQVLSDISTFLRQSINKTFAAARLAEDEFGLLLHDSHPDEGPALARFITERLNTHLAGSGENNIPLDAAIGFAVINDQGIGPETMLNRARNNASLHIAHTALDCKLQDTGQCQEELHFQPMIGFRPDACERYEVLLRMQDSDGHALTPAQVLPLANIHNRAQDIDKRVLGKVLSHLQPGACGNRQLCFHVSSNTLASTHLLTFLSAQLAKNRVPAASLACLVSARDLRFSPKAALAFCRGLEALGIRLVLNHFGASMEPLAVLEQVKPDFVRLDTSLCKDVLYSNQQQQSTRKLVRAVHHHRARVMVTGIEDLDMLPVLWELGVDFVQGNVLQRPVANLEFGFPPMRTMTTA